MDFKQAKRECRRVGTAHASGDALRSMYAELIVLQHPGLNQHSAPKFYGDLQGYADDSAIIERSRELLRDGWAAADVLWE